ncbi:hypothetical protein CH54_510 [Yersinia rochesterensis]|uniref:Uncharacterized protein n=1 Tax=Yersinia rochesterensis TaxID=1604335 RepID=A0ABM5SP17_9GAMM|nr:hypothetical protein [Yersinia rochesterensis]AJI88667.1 hypothetical protein AW19_1152 [Yersinia frederiksenii Y225]AJJ36127.1 hypothetical protein CH54_510 [Yersinia rochesterensis]CRY67091.1 Uncharacterised protein [Yersinia kristensenii]
MGKDRLKIMFLSGICYIILSSTAFAGLNFKIDNSKLLPMPDVLENCKLDENINDFYKLYTIFANANGQVIKNRECSDEVGLKIAYKLDDLSPRFSVEDMQSGYDKNEYSMQKKLNKLSASIQGKVETISISAFGKPVIELKNSKGKFKQARLYIAEKTKNKFMQRYIDQQDGIIDGLSSGDEVLIHCATYSFVMKSVLGQECIIL